MRKVDVAKLRVSRGIQCKFGSEDGSHKCGNTGNSASLTTGFGVEGFRGFAIQGCIAKLGG